MGKHKDRVIWCNQGWQPSMIGFVPSKKAWKREMKRINSDEPWYFEGDGRGAGAYTHWIANKTTGESLIYVSVNPAFVGDNPHELLCSIAHEVSHVVDFAFEHTGMKPCTEMRAYAIEYLLRDMSNAFFETVWKAK